MTSPQPEPELRSGGQILVDQLLIHGVETAFCVPGESYLDVLDALFDVRNRIRLINARHEIGAANMAEAYGKLTGRPGIALVTRGPGACHAAGGLHIAFQDSTPMILLVGQVARGTSERESFQEIDYRKMFGSVVKWVAQIEQVERIPEFIARAFHVATSGRPGPVVLSLPEDMLTDRVAVRDAKPFVAVQARPAADDLVQVRGFLQRAERPLLIVGGSQWSDAACREIVAFAEASGIPAACSFRRQDVFANASECYAGDLGSGPAPSLLASVKQADLLLVVGARLGDMTTRTYSTVQAPIPNQTLIHVHPDADEIGRVFQPSLAIQSGPAAFAAALAEMPALDGRRWSDWTAKLRRDYLETLEVPRYEGALDLGRILAILRERLPADAIVTLDAGNHNHWPQRFLRYGRPGRQLGPTNGAMGYSIPASIAASLTHPDRLVVGFVGDGGMQMVGLELATAVQHGARPIVLLFNNAMYGTIRMHQEREHPTRVVGTDLINPDFAALGRALGCHAETVTTTAQFAPAFERAVAAARPALIELRTDPEVITPRTTISALRQAARNN